MSSNPHPNKCQICGLHLNRDDLRSHEISCLIKSRNDINNDYPTPLDARTDRESANSPISDLSGSDSDAFHSCGSDTFYSYSDEDNYENGYDTGLRVGHSSNPRTSFSSGYNSNETEENPPHSIQIRRSSLVTPTFRYDRKKPKNLFPPTKTYRYYPITCDYCNKKFQPNKLKAHQRREHLIGIDEVAPTMRAQSEAVKMGHGKSKYAKKRSKSVGGIPRRLQLCYICGRMYGSKSIKIHEPKCLDKWRIQNEQLPPEMRAPEPVKPEVQLSVATGKEDYDVPGFDLAAEAAYQSHLSTLIPCKHCSRTFSPDRIQKHQSCCIERPKSRTRECVTPTGGEIPR